MRDIDPALVQQILHIPQRERVANIHHHREADDLRQRLEIAKNAGAAHPIRLAALPVSDKPIFPLTVPASKPDSRPPKDEDGQFMTCRFRSSVLIQRIRQLEMVMQVCKV